MKRNGWADKSRQARWFRAGWAVTTNSPTRTLAFEVCAQGPFPKTVAVGLQLARGSKSRCVGTVCRWKKKGVGTPSANYRTLAMR